MTALHLLHLASCVGLRNSVGRFGDFKGGSREGLREEGLMEGLMEEGLSEGLREGFGGETRGQLNGVMRTGSRYVQDAVKGR